MILLRLPPDPRLIRYTGRTQVMFDKLHKEAAMEVYSPLMGWVKQTAFVCPNTQAIFAKQKPRAPFLPTRKTATTAKLLGLAA